MRGNGRQAAKLAIREAMVAPGIVWQADGAGTAVGAGSDKAGCDNERSVTGFRIQGFGAHSFPRILYVFDGRGYTPPGILYEFQNKGLVG